MAVPLDAGPDAPGRIADSFRPDVALDQIRKLRWWLNREEGPPDHWSREGVAEAMAEVVWDLDDWLSRGGELPAAWARHTMKCECWRHAPAS